MKTYQAFLLGCCLAAPVRAQGQIAVGNRGVMDGIDAPVFDVDCTTRLEGPAYLAQPYAGLSPDSPSPVGIVLAFRTGERAGYVSLLAVSVPGALDGTVVYVQLRAWEARAGHSFEAAVAAGANTVFRTSYPSWPSWHLAHQTPPSACRASVWCRSRGRGRCWRWAARCWRWPGAGVRNPAAFVRLSFSTRPIQFDLVATPCDGCYWREGRFHAAVTNA